MGYDRRLDSLCEDMEQAGADAIELNTYALATDRKQSSGDLESQLVALVTAVIGAVNVPVAVKLSSSFTSLPHLVARLEDAGQKAWCCSIVLSAGLRH